MKNTSWVWFAYLFSVYLREGSFKDDNFDAISTFRAHDRINGTQKNDNYKNYRCNPSHGEILWSSQTLRMSAMSKAYFATEYSTESSAREHGFHVENDEHEVNEMKIYQRHKREKEYGKYPPSRYYGEIHPPRKRYYVYQKYPYLFNGLGYNIGWLHRMS